MTSADWIERLRAASSEPEVVGIASEYLASLNRFELAMLPSRCQPRALRCGHDVSSYAFELVGHYCDATDASARIVHALATFFTQASTRLSEIVTDTNTRHPASRRAE